MQRRLNAQDREAMPVQKTSNRNTLNRTATLVQWLSRKLYIALEVKDNSDKDDT